METVTPELHGQAALDEIRAIRDKIPAMAGDLAAKVGGELCEGAGSYRFSLVDEEADTHIHVTHNEQTDAPIMSLSKFSRLDGRCIQERYIFFVGDDMGVSDTDFTPSGKCRHGHYAEEVRSERAVRWNNPSDIVFLKNFLENSPDRIIEQNTPTKGNERASAFKRMGRFMLLRLKPAV